MLRVELLRKTQNYLKTTHMKTNFEQLSDQVVKRLMKITGLPEDDIRPLVEANSIFLSTTFSNALSADDAVEYCAQTLNTLYY